MKELIGAYWDIAYKEGNTGVSHGTEAQEVLSKINDALERMTIERDSVVWGVDWGKLGDRTSITIVKRRQDGTIEVVATEVEPK